MFKKSNSLFRLIVATFSGIFLGIITFSLTPDDSFNLYVLKQHEKDIKQILAITLDVNIVGNESDDPNLSNNPSSGDNLNNTITTQNVATTGNGLNLLLINNIQTEGFVKEYLSICVENSQGDLAFNDNGVTASVSSIIGINISESKYYTAGNGNTLPKTDLPAGSDGAPIWNSDCNLKSWDKNNHANGGITAVGGPLQYVSNGTITTIIGKSKYNKGTYTAGGSENGDCYLFPDAVVGLNSYLRSGCNVVNIATTQTNLSDSVKDLITVISHNRGAGGLYMIYGIPYRKIFQGQASSYLNRAAISTDNSIKYLEEIYSDITYAPDSLSLSDKLVVADESSYYAQLFPLVARGWLFSETAAANAKLHSVNGMKYWNMFFENEKVNSALEYCAAIDKHTSSLANALGIDANTCDQIYGTENGSYKTYYDKYSYGDVFKVTSGVTNVYSNAPNGAKVVYCLEAMSAQHVYNTLCHSSVVYARMLKYAGVNVDPTNPETYMGEYSENGEWTPTSELELVLKANGLDTTQVTPERMQIIKAAANLIGITYHQCRNGAGRCSDWSACDGHCYNNAGRPSHIDCSALVYRAYLDANFDVKGFPTNTASYQSSTVVEQISLQDIKPGDILVRRDATSGHAMVYLGKDDSKYYVIEASQHGCLSNFGWRSVSTITSTYKAYRYKGLS